MAINKFTAIYSDYFTTGSHQHQLVRTKRFLQDDSKQTVMEAALSADIEPSTIHFLFVGWPFLEGEENISSKLKRIKDRIENIRLVGIEDAVEIQDISSEIDKVISNL